MTIVTRTKVLFDVLSATSRPVWLFVAAEGIVAAAVIAAGCVVARGVAGVLVLDELPRWRALGGSLLLGAAGHLIAAARPVDALRRWHGVAVRRIDERWGDDR
jgi:hypothetical protein